MRKRILLVDDEKNVAFFLAEELSATYEVEMANSGEEALSKLDNQHFDLIITDLRMPGINGLELIKQAREQSPRSRLVLMTAYGNERVEETAYRLGACRYLTKPFQVQELFDIVQTALADVQPVAQEIMILTDEQFEQIAHCLADLRFEVNAQCIILANINGQMLAQTGTIPDIDLQILLSLIGGSFAAALEMTRYLGEDQSLTLNYHEGQRIDVYVTNVNQEVLLVLLFDKRQQTSRIGMVWLYTRRTLRQLQNLIQGIERASPAQIFGDDFNTLLSNSLEQLVTAPSAPEKQNATTAQVNQSPSPDLTADGISSVETFDFKQAMELGLLNPEWLNTLDDQG